MHPITAARRHPGRAILVVLIVLAVALPLTFYLVSPLFIRTTLVEAAPVVAVSSPSPSPSPTATPAVTASPTPSAEPPTLPPSPATTPFAPLAVSTGEFMGTDEVHFGSGTATIIETMPGHHILRLQDFSVLNGPDLFVYLSPDAAGYTDGALELGRLKATDGSFNYDLPAGTDPSDFASAIIWCKQFSHLFAVAALSAG